MRYIISIILISFFSFSFGQGKALNSKKKKDLDKKTLFGIQVSPIIPAGFLEQNDFVFDSDSVNYSINSQTSFSFGAEVRHYFTYRFALNTGILYTKRNISVEYNSHYDHERYGQQGTDTTFSRDLKFIAFEIPVKLSGYVRLSEKIYMSIAGGISLNFYPSDIRVDNVVMQRAPHFGSNTFQFLQIGLSAGLGFEYRTPDSGIIYIGASFQARVDDMAFIMFYENETIHREDYYHAVNGSYFSIDLKYFFALNEK